MGLFPRKEITEQKGNSLFREIALVKREMDTAYNNFQNASDPDLIDCYIYESNAAWKRYRFLLRQAKMS